MFLFEDKENKVFLYEIFVLAEGRKKQKRKNMLKFFHNFFRFAFQKLLTQISFKTEYGFFLLSVWILAVRPSLFLSFSSISSINLSFLPSFSPILTTFFLLSFFFFFLLLFEVFHSTKRAEMRGGRGEGEGKENSAQKYLFITVLFFFFFLNFNFAIV